MAVFRFVFCILVLVVAVNECAHLAQKRYGFVRLGCMGTFDRSKFARLDAVCEECYELFQEPDIHRRCSDNCFNNSDFSRCVKALLLEDEQEELDKIVEFTYGRRSDADC